MPVSLCPRSIRVCLLFAFQRSEGFAASFRVAYSRTAARPGWFRAGGAVRGAGGRRAEAPAGGRDSLDPLGRPSRVFPQLRADGFEAAGTLSDRHHVYDVMFTAYLAPRGCGDWDTPFAYPPGVPHESQA